ncbi:hypothetical protein [Aureliella helgolandensis]|nr:hypothetical protein [Aureliella helgolandensis]
MQQPTCVGTRGGYFGKASWGSDWNSKLLRLGQRAWGMLAAAAL